MLTAASDIAHKKQKFEIDDCLEISDLDREYFGEFARPYLKPYLHNAKFLDKEYGFLKEGRRHIHDW